MDPRVREDNAKFLGRAENPASVMPGETKSLRPLSPAMLAEWEEALRNLAQQFLNGEAQVDPKEYPKSCAFCGLEGLCRIAESDPISSSDDSDDGDD